MGDPSAQPSSQRGEGADRAHFFVGIPHPSPLTKGERELIVPIFYGGSLTQPSPQRGAEVDRANIFVGNPQPSGRE